MQSTVGLLVMTAICGIVLSTADDALCDWSNNLDKRLTAIESRIDAVEECTECDVQPTCVTRWSDISDTHDDALASIQCEHKEVMTGCSSYLPGNAHGTRDGEYIHVESDANPACVARNGGSGSGVKAVARCCNWPKMKCTYKMGPKSGSSDDALSTISCSGEIDGMSSYLTGCLANTWWQQLDGAWPNSRNTGQLTNIINGECHAVNGASGGGVWANAACCASPNLDCKAKWSTKSAGGVKAKATVSCDAGWILTGCNIWTPYKNTDGAYIERERCVAVNGGNNQYVYAIAICCQQTE